MSILEEMSSVLWWLCAHLQALEGVYVHACACVVSVYMCVFVGVAALVKPVGLAKERREGLNFAEGSEHPRCGLGRIPGGDLWWEWRRKMHCLPQDQAPSAAQRAPGESTWADRPQNAHPGLRKAFLGKRAPSHHPLHCA